VDCGLSIVKDIFEKHKGKVEINSVENVCTIVIITLPKK